MFFLINLFNIKRNLKNKPQVNAKSLLPLFQGHGEFSLQLYFYVTFGSRKVLKEKKFREK